jgi:hypothetical protein
LAHIGENIFDQLDGKTLVNCEEVSPIWRQFIVNYGLWKRQYLDKLAKPGSDAHLLIKSNLKLFQADLQGDQSKFQIFADIVTIISPTTLSTSSETTRKRGRGGVAAEESLNHVEGRGGVAAERSSNHVVAIMRRLVTK